MPKKFEEHLEEIDESRRSAIKKIAVGSFVVPVVASFMMKGGVSVALAQTANSS